MCVHYLSHLILLLLLVHDGGMMLELLLGLGEITEILKYILWVPED